MFDRELEISVRARRPTCVVDPSLALATPFGAQLVLRLSQVADVWMVRTFWQVLDSSEYYARDALAFWPTRWRERLPADAGESLRRTLAGWEATRASVDLGAGRLYWLCDNLSESTFPDGTPPDLIDRYEALHRTLTARGDPHDEAPESAAFFGAIDTLALSAALGGVQVLTWPSDAPRGCFAQAVAHAALPLQSAPDGDDPLGGMERTRWQRLLADAGVAPLVWSGLRPAIAHLAIAQDVPAAAAVDRVAVVGFDDDTDYDEAAPAMPGAADPWRDAQVFWHAL